MHYTPQVSISICIYMYFYRHSLLQTSDWNDVHTSLKQLTLAEDISRISIESSSGKHTVADGRSLCLQAESGNQQDYILVTGQRGIAYIICYTKSRGCDDRAEWETQLHYVSVVLKEQFSLEV